MSRHLRVLVLSADLGGGHDAMARALAAELTEEAAARGDAVDVEVANGLRLASRGLHRALRDGYERQLAAAPATYRWWFAVSGLGVVSRVVRWTLWAASERRLRGAIEDREPDVVVSTYPLVTAMLGKLRREGRLDVPAVAMLIDSAPHDLWLAPGIDEHLVPSPEDEPRVRAAWPRQRYYPELRMRVVRPPVDPRCREPIDREAARERFGLPAGERLLLVSGGSWGLAAPQETLDAVLEEAGWQLVVACGRNEELRERLAGDERAGSIHAVGFTSEMPSLLAACDAALLNAGGMTCQECFALGVPVLLHDPIPGHGEATARALEEDRYAAWPRTAADVVRDLGEVADGSPFVRRRVERARELGGLPAAAPAVLDVEAVPLELRRSPAEQAARLGWRHLVPIVLTLGVVGMAVVVATQLDTITAIEWDLSPGPLVSGVLAFALAPVVLAIAYWFVLRRTGAPSNVGDALLTWMRAAVARQQLVDTQVAAGLLQAGFERGQPW